MNQSVVKLFDSHETTLLGALMLPWHLARDILNGPAWSFSVRRHTSAVLRAHLTPAEAIPEPEDYIGTVILGRACRNFGAICLHQGAVFDLDTHPDLIFLPSLALMQKLAPGQAAGGTNLASVRG